MTANPILDAVLRLTDDLTRDLPESERYRRLLETLAGLLPCDAIALLRLDGQQLTPLAVRGLSTDTLGRRFPVAEHPRLATILQNPLPVRFSADSPLPDPYDGLVEGQQGQLHVHDCLGCTLYIDDRPWGVLTLDALEPSRFGAVDLGTLDALGRLAAATVKAVGRMDDLARRAADERLLADTYRETAGLAGPPELIGHSPAHKRLLTEIGVVAASDLTVLITGETGVGKELVAQATHALSHRRRHPLITINCAALPETLVESELFGHVRGAFSGAVSDRRGTFELADQGTLFLDEIGDLPLNVQAKLLRVLQTGQLQRLGSDREHHADVRVLAATNHDLADQVRRGRFRADLYHRLSVYPLHVPPLRERGRDVLLLAGHFLEQYRPRLRVRSLRLSPAAQAALLAYDWPGNVRELEHLIGRAALKAVTRMPDRGRTLTLDTDDLGLAPAVSAAPVADAEVPEAIAAVTIGGDLRGSVDELQRRLITQALHQHQGNWTAAAKHLRLDRANLHRLARRLGIAAPTARPRRNSVNKS